MPRIGIIVSFRLKPGSWEKFDAIIREHARRTREEEPGCERFEAFQPVTAEGALDKGRFMVCEVYRDQAALDAHIKNPRLAVVRKNYADLVESRELTICHLT